MSELQQVPPALQRRHLLEVIEDTQHKALRKLRDAGVPEAQALAVIPRLRSYSLFCLNEYDQLYLAFEEMVERDGRSQAHQRFFNDKVAFVLHAMEAGIAELLAFTIRQAIQSAQQPPLTREVLSSVRYRPGPPAWQPFLLTTLKLLIWLCALPASLLLTTFFTGWDSWALIAPISLCVLWLLVRFSWWGLLFPATVIGGTLFFFLFPVP